MTLLKTQDATNNGDCTYLGIDLLINKKNYFFFFFGQGLVLPRQGLYQLNHTPILLALVIFAWAGLECNPPIYASHRPK
jgi:hypothetical protein